MNKGKFLTFEGGEGSGKTTQSKLILDYLQAKGIEAIWTREIGGTAEAEKIRELVLFEDLLPLSELLLVMAARNEHIEKVIKPAIASGKWVICDRFIDSTAAYQGQSVNLTSGKIYQLHQLLLGGFLPDLTFYLSIPHEVGLKRALLRGANNKFENKNQDYHQLVAEQFTQAANNYSERIKILNAEDHIMSIHHNIITFIEQEFNF